MKKKYKPSTKRSENKTILLFSPGGEIMHETFTLFIFLCFLTSYHKYASLLNTEEEKMTFKREGKKPSRLSSIK